MYIWHQGQPPLPQGTERYVTFIGKTEQPTYVSDWQKKSLSNTIPRVTLLDVYPIPSNGKVFLRYTVQGKDVPISLDVYNVSGQLVQRLFSGKKSTGIYEMVWDGMLSSRRKAPYGIYFLRLDSPVGDFCKKVILLR